MAYATLDGILSNIGDHWNRFARQVTCTTPGRG